MPNDFAVLYRWRVKPGLESQFRDGWRRVTLGILEQCDSFGSRLHECEDGTWVAYARWPSAEARDRCSDGPPADAEGRRLMREASEYVYEDVVLTLVDDLLREPD